MRISTCVRLSIVVAPLALQSCGFGGTSENPEHPNFVGIPDSASVPITLPDNAQPPSNYPSTVTLSGLRHSITSLRVTIVLTHTFPGDVDILLVGPGGQTCMVMSDCLGDTDLVDVGIDFTNTSVTPLPDVTVPPPLADIDYAATDNDSSTDLFPAGGSPPPPVGPYPEDLNVFLGSDPNGVWRLYARDDGLPDAGSITWWAIVGTCE
jgi:subtilisin-like proprotein convertase family protein